MRDSITSLLLCCFMGCLNAAPVVSDNDLLMTRQESGETRRNLTVDGNPLKIAGKEYRDGLGTHATSMLPISVPAGSAALQGACGVDDEIGGAGSVVFRILSGSDVLWQSEVMKKGMPAAEFDIPVPPGARKLYLLADHVENNSNDHADWVNLKWKAGKQVAAGSPKTLNAKDFGIKPGIREDQTGALRKMIAEARAHPGSTLVFPKGEYHFYMNNALMMSFHASNHDQPVFHPVSVPLVDLNGVRLEGNGSVFLFHGKGMPFLLMDSSNVTLNNLAVDFERAFYSEARITEATNDYTDVSIDAKKYPYEIRNNRFSFIGEGWKQGVNTVMAFKKGTGYIAAGTSDLSWSGHVDDLGGGKARLKWNLKARGLEPGDTLVLRSWGRPHPGCVIYRSEKIVMNNFSIHQSLGMALLAQRSSDIVMNGGGIYMREGSGRVHSSGADATHFSNVKGLVKVENGRFVGMMDDAINVHATCLSIKQIKDGKTMLCEYKHGQAVGFEVFLPGENLQFIAGPTLENRETGKIKSVRKLNTKELLITMEKDIPQGIAAGDAVANADYYPAVIFRGNYVGSNRARGTLFTTPKTVLGENNHFDHSSGSAILLAGDAQGWYESGACEDVLIRKNKFTNNLTSRYQFTNAIISIYPEVRQLANQKLYYHRNVVIEDNEFDTFDVPLLFAISTQNLFFRNNTVKYNKDYKGWNKPPFEFKRCSNIRIYGNKVTPAREWSIKDCKLDMTPESEVSFSKK